MNLRDLRYLLAVAEHGHFGRAAEACGSSQPTLSVQLRKLEEQLGVTLFERTGKAVVRTAACEQLIGHVRAAVAEADAVLAVARNLREPLAGRFRLGIIPTLAPYLLPLIFAPLREALPALEVEPWEDQTIALLERLRTHELDAVLLATQVDGPDLASQPLFAEPFLAALPPEHPLAGREVVAEAELARDILVLADGHCLRDQALNVCRLVGASEKGGFQATSLETLRQMVAANVGITLLPMLAVQPPMVLPGNVQLLNFQDSHPPSRRIGLVWRRSSAMSGFLQQMAELFRNVPPELFQLAPETTRAVSETQPAVTLAH